MQNVSTDVLEPGERGDVDEVVLVEVLDSPRRFQPSVSNPYLHRDIYATGSLTTLPPPLLFDVNVFHLYLAPFPPFFTLFS